MLEKQDLYAIAELIDGRMDRTLQEMDKRFQAFSVAIDQKMDKRFQELSGAIFGAWLEST
ncbi:MAG: hypothetical protein HFI68_03540 [Lachnospiraceae bacterium]|nr:hypothetical protein [Lachnospiraceae bacterium]